MKRFENLGAQLLTKEQQKKVSGGNMICVCGDGTAFICSGNSLLCEISALKTCANRGKTYCNSR